MNRFKSNASLKKILVTNPVRHRSILYWSILNLVDSRGSVILVDTANSFLEYLSKESTSCPVIRAFSLAACEKYGEWVEPLLGSNVNRKDQVAAYPAVLGESRSTLEYQFYNSLAVGSRPLSLKIKQETLDSAFGGLSGVSFIYINDSLRLLKILKGGQVIIEGQRPALATSGIRESEMFDVLSWCESCDYILLDACMSPVVVDQGDANHIADLILLPKESMFIADDCKKAMFSGIFNGLGILGNNTEILPASALVEDINLNLVGSFGVETGVIEPFLYGKELSVPLDNIVAKNWYDFESDGSVEWRWSGPDKDSTILLNLPAPGFYHVIMDVMNLIDDSLKGKAKLYINGLRQPEAGRNAVEGGNISADFYVPEEGFDGIAELLLALPNTMRASPADPRLLGLALKSINLYWRAN